jgi:hypothetical protein
LIFLLDYGSIVKNYETLEHTTRLNQTRNTRNINSRTGFWGAQLSRENAVEAPSYMLVSWLSIEEKQTDLNHIKAAI